MGPSRLLVDCSAVTGMIDDAVDENRTSGEERKGKAGYSDEEFDLFICRRSRSKLGML